jgi:glycosyltransferase involved in cell wall biosynthesis
MPQRLFISVIIPNLHTPVIGATLDALRRQTWPREQTEVIVVGQDRFGIVETAEGVTFLRTETPVLPGQARNHGAGVARGDVLAFLDADCVPAPQWLDILAERFADPRTNVVGGSVDFGRDQYWKLADNLSTFRGHLPDSPGESRRSMPSLNLSVRRSVFLEVGGFDERRATAEDMDLCARLSRAGCMLYFERRAVIWHNPPRTELRHLWQHAYTFGHNSLKVDPRYAGQPEAFPGWLRRPVALILLAPFMAAGVTVRTFLPNRRLWPMAYVAPGVFLAKLAWCLGAARRLMEGATADGD